VTHYIERAGLKVADNLARFIDERALPGTGIEPDAFWAGAADIFARFAPENAELLATRDMLQAKIDAWHAERVGQPWDAAAYRGFLENIGYLAPEPAPFTISTENVDPEVAAIAGPQLVVPILNARFLLNAANARWGSLYDALYGTDALGQPPIAGAGYDEARGAQVVARAKTFLDETAPLAAGRHGDATGYSVRDGALWPALEDPRLFAGYRGEAAAPASILLRHHGLHIEILIDRAHPIGGRDPAGVADILLESALTTIADLEDSVAAVDAEDKVEAYANWLGLMTGALCANFDKGGRALTRRLNPDRNFTAPDGSPLVLPARSLMMIRTVGHLMTTPAMLLRDGSEAPEGILDGIVAALIAKQDLIGRGTFRNSRAGAIYIVKPKMHGPAEADFADRLFDAIEDMLRLERHVIKLGLMDEERRTSANLAACIHALRHRLMFINTGFLDRTGDEIHTSMHAGPMVPKGEMRVSEWIAAYEDRNVLIGLACGLAGKAQIGKGMWAMPDRMADMLAQKIAHPQTGASTAWVPSPTAATLHAIHYHAIDVPERQAARSGETIPDLERLLTPPLATGRNWSPDLVRAELENNAQSILGYVVRWVGQGIGCSKVPDIHDVALMEDRATLRISSQHMANWLLHGVASAEDAEAALTKMAGRVDQQNREDEAYRAMSPDPAASQAFQAARALVFAGTRQPNGYTEPLLHRFRHEVKRQPVSAEPSLA